MAAGLLDAYEATTLDDVFRTPGTGTARSLYLALYRWAGASGTGDGVTVSEAGTLPTNLVEVSASGYSRLALTAADFGPAVVGAPTMKQLVTSKTWSALANFGEIVSWALCLGSTAGVRDEFCVGPVTDTRGTPTRVQVNLGDIFGFNADVPLRVQLGDPADTFMLVPPRVIFILLDDARWDDFSARMTSGPRAGQLVMQNAVTRIRNKRSLVFTQIRCDYAVCTPTRENAFTAQAATTHQVTGSFDPEFDYIDPIRVGRRVALKYVTPASNRNAGPWERDRALQRQVRLGGWGTAGAVSQDYRDESADAVSGGSQVSATRPVKDQRFDANDDLQYWTGSLPTWLAQAGVTCGLVGKYQNMYATSITAGVLNTDPAAPAGWTAGGNSAQTELFVPPGWSYWACLNGTDDPTYGEFGGGAQNHYAARFCTWEGTAVPAAEAQGPATQYATAYKRPVSSLTRVGTLATCVVGSHSQPLAPQGHMMAVGDEFAIELASDAGWNYFMWTVESVIDADTFTFRLAGSRPAPVTPQPPSLPAGTTAAPSGTVINVYPLNQYGESLWGKYGADFINKRRENEPWYLYYAPDNPHEGTLDAHGDHVSGGVEVARRYDPQGLAATIDWTTVGLWWEGLKYWTADRIGPCTWTGAGVSRIFAADRRDDGSGPFDARILNRPVTDAFGGVTAGTYIPAGTTVTAVDSSLPGATGGWVDISNPTVAAMGAASRTLCLGDIIANPDGYTSTYRQSYVRRQAMLASADDTIGTLLDACEARGWHNVTLIVASDNGWQQGEWDTREETGSTAWYQKGRIYEGSTRMPLYMKGPDFPLSATSHVVGSAKDIPLTILDIFGNWGARGGIDLTPLTSHHAHTKRDGRSLLRVLNPADVEANRSVYLLKGNGYGKLNGDTARNNYEGIVGPVGGVVYKYVREINDTGVVGSSPAWMPTFTFGGVGTWHLYRVTQDDNGRYLDYEATDLASANPTIVATLNDRLNRMRVGHWNPATQTNGHRVASYT